MKRFPRVICDTAWFVALFDARDACHEAAEEIHQANKKERRELITHWGVIGETLTLLRRRASYRSAEAFSASLGSYTILEVSTPDALQIVGLFGVLTTDKILSYVDVVTYFLAVHRLGRPPVLTFDEDFRRLGLHVIP